MSETNNVQEYSVDLPARIIWDLDDKEMVLIPQGQLVMGRDDGQGNEKPQHTVTIKSFYIDRYPVTQAEYHRFVKSTEHPIPYYAVDWLDPDEYNWHPETHTPPADKLDHPVVMVSWDDAQAYCAWARKRLPTEAEWERAARGRNGLRWPWGNEFERRNCNSRESSIRRTTAVYRFSPFGDSPDGIADMVGNVWEWTASLYWPYPYTGQDGREGLEARGWRVLRGGSWSNDLTLANATARLDGDFVFFTNVGFRCAVSADVVRFALERDEQ
jgi:formylglycine-generating enzyme required for sulfatase activity